MKMILHSISKMIDLWRMRENYSIVTIECNKKNSEFSSFSVFSFCPLACFKSLLLKITISPKHILIWIS